ncbi:helix-turn-helix transcriptional regulator [Raoultella ornithinolytica]|uniref:XRE family transcriptional regulator n=1 Tax=Klebsiella/Raoultella group TaxID=2890311 RepID=UPI001A1DBE79|nr:helix-turn-helix transcriptional regulator [Raoultella ornithinolytica]MBV0249360.1 helix-turn-helix transcriptional regulator [Klebsiella pneumoniae]MBV0331165.1 helix-turn-helix transcriptional regulator [Klebsiella pneumoniae]MCA5484020.1 helix-turn-helix transcriptional regulator [Klebsiella pneumoniae]MCA5525398.1 helix-turn-helix transcriptional regulator [Klebsiella pneumoniae]MDC7945024.1 helix-turn-helix transcriptional regulator [Raoultella ornithinolytica]
MSKTTFAERLVESMKAAGFTQASLAAAVGMSQSSIWKLTSGAASGSRKTVELAKALHVRPEWLASGELPVNDNESNDLPTVYRQQRPVDPGIYRVDLLDVQVSAGPGVYLSSEFIETVQAIEFKEEYARSMFGSRPASSIKVITVRGDSMEGTIDPGDYIFVDTSVNHFEGDGIYVFVFGKTIHIKRLQMQKNSLVVLSDNKLYSPWEIDACDEDQFHVLAKVLVKQSAAFKRFA